MVSKSRRPLGDAATVVVPEKNLVDAFTIINDQVTLINLKTFKPRFIFPSCKEEPDEDNDINANDSIPF